MASVDSENQCIAKTQSDARCSRVAKDGRFCFQHGPDSETVEVVEPQSQHDFSIVPDGVNIRPEQLQGVQKDLAQNIEDLFESASDLTESLTSLEFDEALSAFKNTTTSTAPTPAKYALVGGGTGTIGGPLGVAAGGTAGAWVGVYKVLSDDRAVQAQIVEEVPDDADIVDTDQEAIKDVEPIQMAIKSAIETSEEENEWLRSTLLRERNMDSVESALAELPAYENPQGIREYYIRDRDSGEVLLLLFGEVDE